jgi:hypothetical protein
VVADPVAEADDALSALGAVNVGGGGRCTTKYDMSAIARRPKAMPIHAHRGAGGSPPPTMTGTVRRRIGSVQPES